MQTVSLHRYSQFMVVCVFFLINTGAMVTSTHSGLSVPDWPLSFGGFFPRMVGGVFYEHGHRVTALVIILLTAVLAAWTWKSGQDRTARFLTLAAIGAVLLQALLGGLTVIFKLPVAVSTGHAGLAQIFFCLVIAFALVTSPGWKARQGARPLEKSFSGLAWATVACVYAQILIGATIRHEYIGLAIPDFPLSLGRVVPPLDSWMVVLNFTHRVLAGVIFMLILFNGLRLLAFHGEDPWIARPARFLIAAVLLQVGLGAFTIWTGLQPAVASAHVAGGALVLSTSLVLALRCGRAA